MGLLLRLVTRISARRVRRHEREELEERQGRCPAWEGSPWPWAERSRCDRCRASLAYLGSNFAVPRGTPVVCGPCAAGVDPDEEEE